MSIIYKSNCVPYTTHNNITSAVVPSYTFVSSDAKCSDTLSPSAYPVTITVDRSHSPTIIYHVSIGPVGGQNNINYDFSILNNVATLGNIPGGVSVVFGPNGNTGTQSCGNGQTRPNGATTIITLALENNSLYPTSDGNPPFVINDRYIINTLSCCDTNSVDVLFERPLWSTEKICTELSCVSNCQNIKIPSILINGQTKINGSDVADMLFTIYDKYSYTKEKPLSSSQKHCTIEYLDKDKVDTTVLRQCSAKMVSVVRGKGETLYCKVDYIWLATDPNMYFTTLYSRIIKYGMLKYILSRLLYGDFNINYLLGKYNDKFLEDLGNSRFCSYLVSFLDCNSDIYSMGKYFKYGKDTRDHHDHDNKHNHQHNNFKDDNQYQHGRNDYRRYEDKHDKQYDKHDHKKKNEKKNIDDIKF